MTVPIQLLYSIAYVIFDKSVLQYFVMARHVLKCPYIDFSFNLNNMIVL